MNRHPLHIEVGGREGRDSEESHAATVACLRGLWNWIAAPVRWMRTLCVCEWMAIALMCLALAASWARR